MFTAIKKINRKYVIHTVGPVYSTRAVQEKAALLASCYKRSLKIAAYNNLTTIVREALVYISYTFSSPGIIREEYMSRMELAMADGKLLGLSEEYLNSLSEIIHR